MDSKTYSIFHEHLLCIAEMLDDYGIAEYEKEIMHTTPFDKVITKITVTSRVVE